MALTDTAVRQAKPSGKNYTLKDSGGLALFVGLKGAKQWHFRFYWLGKQARISLGVSRQSVSKTRARRGTKRVRWSPRVLTLVPIAVKRDWPPVPRRRTLFVAFSQTGARLGP